MSKLITHDSVFFTPEYHDLIGLVYDSVTHPEGFFPFLKRFIEVFEGHSASFAIFDTRANVPIGYWVVNIPEHALAFYVDHIAHQDALMETALAIAQDSGRPRFVASNLDLGENMEQIRKETRAGEWLESWGAHEAIGSIAFQSDNYLNFFGMQRSRHQPEFTREELAIFDLFLPHLNRAVGLYTKMTASNLAAIHERQALNAVQRGILICDATFKVAFNNDTANQVINNNGDLQLSDEGLLTFREKQFNRQFIIHLATAVRGSMTQTETEEAVLCYRKGKQNITLVISPLAATEQEHGVQRGGAMVSLYDWTMRPSVNPETLRHFFQLSAAEARVSALLLEGHSPVEIAQLSNRSRETVKSQLSSVYRKTNTSRQGELIALLASSAALN